MSRVRRVAGHRALRVDHIGSTSVPGLEAKDVLDVQVVVDAMATAPINKEAFAAAGIPWRGHTELLAHLTGTSRFAMMFYAEALLNHYQALGIPVINPVAAYRFEKSKALQADLFLRREEELDAGVRAVLRQKEARGFEHRGDGRLVVGAEDRPTGVSDDTILDDGDAQSMVRQGVTSMILGEGGSAAPTERFPDFASYFAELRRRGVGRAGRAAAHDHSGPAAYGRGARPASCRQPAADSRPARAASEPAAPRTTWHGRCAATVI